MSDRTKFVKVESSDNPSRADMPRQSDLKSQPAKLSDRDREGQGNGSYHGDAHDFNIKGKVTAMGGNYQDLKADPNAGFNGSDKDSSISYLENRNKKGQETRQYTATTEYSRDFTGPGITAYESMPIPETYIPATSNGAPDPNAVEYNTEKKNRNVKRT